jgi:hypothetical protein
LALVDRAGEFDHPAGGAHGGGVSVGSQAGEPWVGACFAGGRLDDDAEGDGFRRKCVALGPQVAMFPLPGDADEQGRPR